MEKVAIAEVKLNQDDVPFLEVALVFKTTVLSLDGFVFSGLIMPTDKSLTVFVFSTNNVRRYTDNPMQLATFTESGGAKIISANLIDTEKITVILSITATHTVFKVYDGLDLMMFRHSFQAA